MIGGNYWKIGLDGDYALNSNGQSGPDGGCGLVTPLPQLVRTRRSTTAPSVGRRKTVWSNIFHALAP